MSKEILYIVDTSQPYNGRIVNTMNAPKSGQTLENTGVHYVNIPFSQYNDQKGGHLIALGFDDYYQNYEKPYLESLQKPFQEITEEKYYDLLECLPPKRWTQDDSTGINFFFLSEAYTSHLHSCVVRYEGKYYVALRSILDSTKKIIESILKDLN